MRLDKWLVGPLFVYQVSGAYLPCDEVEVMNNILQILVVIAATGCLYSLDNCKYLSSLFMVHIWNRYYRSFSLDYLKGDNIVDFEPLVDTTMRLWVWSVSTFNNMEDDPCNVVRDQFLH